jgi:penicillin-insensitive murein endopeptidase
MDRARSAPPLALLYAALAVGAFGCAHLRVSADDDGSGSRGKPSGGWLVRGAHLPPRGAGYEVLREDRDGGQHWGTARLVALVQRVGRALAPRLGGVALKVGDMSAQRGGVVPRHRSHRNGRDVDIVFFARDEATGEPVPAPDFVRYNRDGLSLGRATPLRFDVERNWNLVEALLRDDRAGVARVFVADWLKRMLLDHARERGKAPWLIDRAERVLTQPGDSLPHDDHFHVRVACTTAERYLGCVDGAPLWPWMRKDWEKSDALPNDDEAVLDLMAPLESGALHGPADPSRATALVCAPPPATVTGYVCL